MHSAHHACETIDLLHQETPDFIPPNLWHPNIPDLNPVYYSRLSTWLLTTSVEDFERASIRKKDNSNTTCELTISILSVSVTFSVTFVWMLPCYSFHSQSVPATPTITPTTVFVLEGSAAAKSVCGDTFYSTLRCRYLLLDLPKRILKLDSSCQSYSKCYRGTLFCLAVSCERIVKIDPRLTKLC